MQNDHEVAGSTVDSLKEYELVLNLAMHDDTLLQARNSNFLTVNALLFAAVAAIITAEQAIGNVHREVVGLSLVGLLISVIWLLLQMRHSEVFRFRRYLLRHLESKAGLSMYTNAEVALYERKPLSLPGAKDSFELSLLGAYPASKSEKVLSSIMGLAWILVLLNSASLIKLAEPAG